MLVTASQAAAPWHRKQQPRGQAAGGPGQGPKWEMGQLTQHQAAALFADDKAVRLLMQGRRTQKPCRLSSVASAPGAGRVLSRGHSTRLRVTLSGGQGTRSRSLQGTWHTMTRCKVAHDMAGAGGD